MIIAPSIQSHLNHHDVVTTERPFNRLLLNTTCVCVYYFRAVWKFIYYDNNDSPSRHTNTRKEACKASRINDIIMQMSASTCIQNANKNISVNVTFED